MHFGYPLIEVGSIYIQPGLKVPRNVTNFHKKTISIEPPPAKVRHSRPRRLKVPSYPHRAEFRPGPLFRSAPLPSKPDLSLASLTLSFNIKHVACISAANPLTFPFFFPAC